MHEAVATDLGSHLDGQQAGPGADVHDVLARTKGEDPPHLAALPDDVRRGVDGFEPAGAGLVELQHPGHGDLLFSGATCPGCRATPGKAPIFKITKR